jgi:adenosylmethionine-8-amino-7-oxononanoate aminotransferase
LNKVFFVGGSGGEACEASMKLSYQFHCAIGKPKKKWFISRKQSYHGSSSDAMAIGDRPNLLFYKPFFPRFRAKISEHNKYRGKNKEESDNDYENRCVKELESKIIKIGPENVSGFVAETIMGGLTGDVPPTKNYWKKIRAVCNKYKIHLIIDEVWCGTGTSGKIYCIDWDEVSPDIIFIGKTLAAGYSPISAYITSNKISDIVMKKDGSIKFSTTYQGHSLGVAAALGVQGIINNEIFLKNVVKKGEYLRKILQDELKSNEFFCNVRGRGLRNSLEYDCKNKHLFGIALTDFARKNKNLLISAKWHRVCFSPAINISNYNLDKILDNFIYAFRAVSKNWTYKKIMNVKFRNYF